MIRSPASLRSLERRHAKGRAQIAVTRYAYCLITNWDAFMAAEMDAVAILRKMRVDPNSLHTWPKTMRYINKCISEGRPPDFRALITMLAPWTVNWK